MSYGPYAPPQQYQQPVQQQPTQAQPQYNYQQPQPSATYQPQYRVVERAEKDIAETLTPKLTAILIVVSAVIVYLGVVIVVATAAGGITMFQVGRILAASGLLIASIIVCLLSMQEKLEARHRATYYAIPVLAIVGMVMLL